MTDYQPLLARALKGLDRNTSEARRGVYDRARQALLNQLRSANPPMADADVTRERLALEDAIRKVETDAVLAEPHTVRSPSAARMPGTPRPATPVPAPISAAPSLRTAASAPPTPRIPMPNTVQPRIPMPPSSASAPAIRAPQGSASPALPLAPRAPFPNRPLRPAAPVNGMRPPRDLDAGLPPRLREEEMPPALNDVAEETEAPALQARRFERKRPPPPEMERTPESHVPQPNAPRQRSRQMPHGGRPISPQAQTAAPVREPESGSHRTKILVAGVAVLLIAIGGVLAYSLRGRMLISNPSAPQSADADQAKSSERIAPSADQGQFSPSPSNVDPAVAQRAVLYEENPGGGQQFQNFVGTAVWKTEAVTAGSGRAPELGLRVEVDIPDRHLNIIIKMRRNSDATFPASHTIEVQFVAPGDAFGGVADMKGIRAKGSETAQGNPIVAQVEKVKDSYFLLALPNVEEDTNLAFIRERDWIDIPFVYANGRRAVLTFQKGTPGDRAVNEAFSSWGKTGAVAPATSN